MNRTTIERWPPLRLGACAAAAAISVILSMPLCDAADEPAEGLREGWKWRTSIPALKSEGAVIKREARVSLWVEKGWLLVRRATVDDELEWQVVLARASDSARPQIKVN